MGVGGGGGLKFSIPGFFWVGKSSKYFFRWPDVSRVRPARQLQIVLMKTQTQTIKFNFFFIFICERFEPRSHFKSRLSLIVRVNVVLNRTVVVDSE